MADEPIFPHPQDKYPVVYLEDTDVELPEHVVNKGLRYTNFQLVASGGKCIIQSCRDYHLSRTIAHKSLRPEIADDPLERRRFLREARVTAMLQHPNTIPVYDLSRNNRGHYFFTMKLLEGYTLREILDMGKADGTAPVDGYGFHRMVTILIQIGNCLDYAHTHGVVHRDVKPPNILTGPFGETTLLDWGLAKVWNETPQPIPDLPLLFTRDTSLTAQGRLQGTLHYMSPEQIEASPRLDHRTDIYSMGVMLWEILAGRSMLEGDDIQDLLHQVKNVVPPRPSAVATDRQIPKQLEDLCMRCIAKDPDERIGNARRLVSALRSWRLRWASEAR